MLAVVRHTEKDVELLARLIRAEAEGEGKLGMLMVKNVGVNRVRADCLDFQDIRTIEEMVFQRPGGFEATLKGYFYQRARDVDYIIFNEKINYEYPYETEGSNQFSN